ncbi:MAG: hypothetical protein HYW24_00810 [Candidatus Aenigmarchaeota archaeon]|nr:hypothetical protein [Candidatus Aenigmarchaeota archaeon]
MITKKTERSKAISIIRIVYIVLVTGTITIAFTVYSSYESQLGVTGKSLREITDEINDIREKMSRIEMVIPKGILESIYTASDAKFGMAYTEVTRYTAEGQPTATVIFKNSGTVPLSDFKVFLNGNEINPYYKPVIVFADEKGIVVLEPQQWEEWKSSEGVIEIRTVKNVSLEVSASKIR